VPKGSPYEGQGLWGPPGFGGSIASQRNGIATTAAKKEQERVLSCPPRFYGSKSIVQHRQSTTPSTTYRPSFFLPMGNQRLNMDGYVGSAIVRKTRASLGGWGKRMAAGQGSVVLQLSTFRRAPHAAWCDQWGAVPRDAVRSRGPNGVPTDN
jgi:hypothetical protein